MKKIKKNVLITVGLFTLFLFGASFTGVPHASAEEVWPVVEPAAK